jgi:hypothetical protein
MYVISFVWSMQKAVERALVSGAHSWPYPGGCLMLILILKGIQVMDHCVTSFVR